MLKKEKAKEEEQQHIPLYYYWAEENDTLLLIYEFKFSSQGIIIYILHHGTIFISQGLMGVSLLFYCLNFQER